MTTNRLALPSDRRGFISVVAQLLDAVVRQDRWATARRATGPLLQDVLNGSYDSYFGTPVGLGAFVTLGDAPVVLKDNGIAVVIAQVTGPYVATPIPIAALLVRSTSVNKHWYVASLTQDELVDAAFQRRVQYEQFPIDDDLDTIAAHGPLDLRAAAIDWDNDSVVLLRTDSAVVTVADAREELAKWGPGSWHWLADECHTFAGLYLRGRHPELVREFPSRSGDRQ